VDHQPEVRMTVLRCPGDLPADNRLKTDEPHDGMEVFDPNEVISKQHLINKGA
jgi:hypothetical protein